MAGWEPKERAGISDMTSVPLLDLSIQRPFYLHICAIEAPSKLHTWLFSGTSFETHSSSCGAAMLISEGRMDPHGIMMKIAGKKRWMSCISLLVTCAYLHDSLHI